MLQWVLIIDEKIALDLLRKMLEADPAKRITAAQALKHPFLEPVMKPEQNALEENIDENDDHSDLTDRIHKINEEYLY